MSARTVALNRIFQSSQWANALNARDRKHLRDLLDQAYRAGQWRVVAESFRGLQADAREGRAGS